MLHVPTIKPLDEATILREASRTGRMVVVAENHTVVGGLGEAVAALLMRSDVRPAAFRQIALPDEFLDAGALPTLHERYGISAEAVARRVKGWLWPPRPSDVPGGMTKRADRLEPPRPAWLITLPGVQRQQRSRSIEQGKETP